jgi:thiol:disulfide interchange protein DsbA
MTLSRRRFHQLCLSVLGASLLPSVAHAELVQGRDWRPIAPPQPSEVPGKIEVLEFFAYGCPHCGDLNPLIESWAKTLPEDVAFRRVPVSFGRAAWANLAKLYFALELLGELPRLDQAVFEALHRGRVSLFTGPAIRAWVAEKGIDAKTFQAAFESFDVDVRLKRSDQLVRDYKVDAVPMIAVAGRYAVTGQAVKGQAGLLHIADELIALARAQAGGTPAGPAAQPQSGS